jgi:hypothetical protein
MPGDQFVWQVWDNGTIISKTGLVLAANSSASRTQLSAQLNQYTTGQSWLPTNTTEPPVYQIAGLFGRYLHADGEAVLLLDYSDATEELTHGRLSGSSAATPAHPFSDGYSQTMEPLSISALSLSSMCPAVPVFMSS